MLAERGHEEELEPREIRRAEQERLRNPAAPREKRGPRFLPDAVPLAKPLTSAGEHHET